MQSAVLTMLGEKNLTNAGDNVLIFHLSSAHIFLLLHASASACEVVRAFNSERKAVDVNRATNLEISNRVQRCKTPQEKHIHHSY